MESEPDIRSRKPASSLALRRRQRPESARSAIIVLVVLECVAIPVWLRVGRSSWFSIDEWYFLTSRTAGDLSDLLREHYGHWVTLPVLTYRFLWWRFGIRTYLPYQLLAIGGHIALTTLLCVVMRRGGVSKWIAVAATASLLFFGPGSFNILIGFQITLVGSVAFGLIHMLLADRDGAIGGRDWTGLGAGLAGLMCSGIGIVMVSVVGMSVMIRRGWKAALFHTMPLAAITVSYLLFRPGSGSPASGARNPSDFLRFMLEIISRTFFNLSGTVAGIGIVLAVAAGVGGASALLRRGVPFRHPDALPPSAAMVFALLFGAFLTACLLAATRASGPLRQNDVTVVASEPRYQYLLAVFVVPAIALGIRVVAATWRIVGAVGCLVLVGGTAMNVTHLGDNRIDPVWSPSLIREQLFAVANLDVAQSLPPQMQTGYWFAPGPSVGWIVANADSGRIPDPPASLRPGRRATVVRDLVLRDPQEAEQFGVRPVRPCTEVGRRWSGEFQKGDAVRAQRLALSVRYTAPDGVRSSPVLLAPGTEKVVMAGPIRLSIRQAEDRPHDGYGALICRQRIPRR